MRSNRPRRPATPGLVCIAALAAAGLFAAGAGAAAPQQPPTAAGSPGQPAKAPAKQAGAQLARAKAAADRENAAIRTTYVLGPDDEVDILALEAEEISGKPMRLDANGTINLPMIGRVQAGGLNIEQLEAEITNRLKKYIREPQVAVRVSTFRSQPVSVTGCVGAPGVHQLEGNKTLVEMIAKAGGLRNDAGYLVNITRRPEWGAIPLPSATSTANGFSIARVNMRAIIDARAPEENIQIRPNDVITVPKADIVYVIGDVNKAGGYVLERETTSVMKAIAMATGLAPTASKKRARITRATGEKDRTEIEIDLESIMNGKKPDPPLRGDDILYVPNSLARAGWRRGFETAIQALTSVVIYRGLY
jgi:polysaccharide export outer membrane protein